MSRTQWVRLLRNPDLALVTIVIHLLALSLPLALLQIYDRILPSQSYGTTAMLVLGVGTAIVLEAMLRYGRMAIFARYGSQYEARTLTEIFDRLMHSDIERVERVGIASIMDSVRAVSTVRDWWSGNAAVGLYELPFIFLYLGLIGYVGGWLAFIPLGLFLLAAIIAWLYMAKINASVERLEYHEQERRNLLWSSFFGLADIKARGAENGLSRFYQDVNTRYMASSANVEAQGHRMREMVSLMAQLSTVLVVVFGALEVMAGNLTTGALSACTLLAGRSISPAMAGFSYLTRLGHIKLARNKVDTLMGIPPSHPALTTPTSSAFQPSGNLHIESEYLAAPLEVREGEIIHISAVDGTLTSNLLASVAGLRDIPEISVSIGGMPISQIPLQTLRASVCLVTRHPALVSGSILNNLTLFDPRFNQRANELSEELGLKSYLDHLRSGILSEIGPLAAESLDDGIAQRIALIRALVRQPRILLLDHAASGLDLDGEARLAELLSELKGKTTVLIVSAREKVLAQCDRHVALKETAHV
ncbi:MAG: ATP-binding cassette domain-containing protein [Pseudomonadaceae bacterium]|jgi:ATP-binding cassette subfamily C protein LapB|nr:ATP-binding cassette domain-containing protein [Pseudomonadaceae bacterium]